MLDIRLLISFSISSYKYELKNNKGGKYEVN